MEIEIAGHSGCSIEVANENNRLFVYKSTRDPSYAGRLRQQALKQRRFQAQAPDSIKTPHILSIEAGENACRIKMEYVYSLNFITFLENAGYEQINNFLGNIIGFVESEIALCELKTIEERIFAEKYWSVRRNILTSAHTGVDGEIKALLPELDRIFGGKLAVSIPVGVCHGDLTLSNILFNGGCCYLIDFLDSFIETPLMDIVKLRQDTAFNWSGLMYQGTYDHIRHQIALRLMDERIHDFFSKYQWYHETYPVFQLMNFLRILQYAHDPVVIRFLKTSIVELLKNHAV